MPSHTTKQEEMKIIPNAVLIEKMRHIGISMQRQCEICDTVDNLMKHDRLSLLQEIRKLIGEELLEVGFSIETQIRKQTINRERQRIRGIIDSLIKQ